jgi:outer membrane protein assembly factor BamB
MADPKACCCLQVKGVVLVTAAGPPSRLYALRTKTGAKLWEFQAANASVVIKDLAAPAHLLMSHGRAVFVTLTITSSNSSWVQALDISTGSTMWQSDVLQGVQLERLELYGSSRLLATSADSQAVFALNASTGQLLWQQELGFCPEPSPVAQPYAGELLLPSSCLSLSGLVAVSAATGRPLWREWEVPADAVPTGSCTWMAEKEGRIVFGCSCNITPKTWWKQHSSRDDVSGLLQDNNSRGSSSSSRQIQQFSAAEIAAAAQLVEEDSPGQLGLAASVPANHPTAAEQGVCLYSVRVYSGRLDWVLPVAGSIRFPEGAQQWGMAPLLHQGLALFVAASEVLAVDGVTGRVAWTAALEAGELSHAWLLPAVEPINNILLVPAQQGPNKTAIMALSVVDGQKVWHRVLNGTGQVPASFGEAQQLLLSGDGSTLYVETCKGRTCCLRALNVLTGKQKWGMCLAAEQGEDATHPHAQFAIWLVTLITIGSICLLILGACMVYVHKWREEHALLFGNEVDSPRHTYRPLPDKAHLSDSEGEEPQGNAPSARPGSFMTYLRQAQAAEHHQHGVMPAAAGTRQWADPHGVRTSTAAAAPSDSRQSAWISQQDQ